jgi:MATE family multidrug resistance protein
MSPAENTANAEDPWSRAAIATELRAIARLAGPVVVAQLGMMMLGVVDVMMVGRVDEHAMAAVAAGHTFAFALMIFAIGVVMVLDPVVSQAWGAREPEAVSHAFWRGVVLAIVMSIVIGAGLWFGEPLMRWLMGDSEIVPEAYRYASWLIPGLPGYFLFNVVRQVLQAMSVVRPIVFATIAGNLANVLFNYMFIFGEFGAPEMGAPGSAVSTSLCRYVMFGALLFASYPALRGVIRRPGRSVLEPRPYAPLVIRGSQIGFQSALEVWLFNAVGILMVRMGSVEMAGHQVALNLASVSFMIPFGIGAAAATRVGNAVGRGDLLGAKRAAFGSLLLGGSVMIASAMAFLLFPTALSSLYTDQPEVVAMAAALLPIAAIFQVFDGVQAVGCGVLRGVADTKVAAFINLFGFWGVGLPACIGLAHGLGYGPVGLWWGLTISLATVAALLVTRIVTKIGRAEVLARM